MPQLVWIGGPMMLVNGRAYGMWFNHDLTPWRNDESDTGMWFGRRHWVETKHEGDIFRRTIIALGLIALVKVEMLA